MYVILLAGWLLVNPVISPAAEAQDVLPAVGFHHVHMNVVDPERSISFYTRSFQQTRRTAVAGWDAVQSEESYLLFTEVPHPASAELDTALWHFGWNSPDLIGDHQRLAAQGAVFFRVPPPSGHMTAPDGNDVEISPAYSGSGGTGPRAFNHVHLMSAAPLCAAMWYERMFGLDRVSADGEPPTGGCDVPFGSRRDPGNQIHQPHARLRVGDIILFIYPNQRPSRSLVSPRGRVLDHIAVTLQDVPATIERLSGLGVRILEGIHNFGNTALQSAMIEGPDGLVIELVERTSGTEISR